MTNWPTTKGLSPCLDPEAVREHLNERLPAAWGARVDERMTSIGMNNAQLAVLSGTTPQTISKVRKGELVPRDYLRVMIAAALGTTTDHLFRMPDLKEIEASIAPRRRRRVA